MSKTPYEGAPIDPEEDGSYDCRVCNERVTSGDFADLIRGTCGKDRCVEVVNRAVSFKTARTERIMNTPVEEFFRATEPVEVEETPEEAAERIHNSIAEMAVRETDAWMERLKSRVLADITKEELCEELRAARKREHEANLALREWGPKIEHMQNRIAALCLFTDLIPDDDAPGIDQWETLKTVINQLRRYGVRKETTCSSG